MATYATEIQWGGVNAPWHADADLEITICNRHDVVPSKGAPANGTQVSWSGTQGSAAITFFEDGSFSGSAVFPGEGPVGYRGRPR